MPAPLGVSIAFDDATLDPDPTWTRLDGASSIWSVQEYTIDRGRDSELDVTGMGTAKVKLIGQNGDLDPTNASGDYFGLIEPLKQAAIALWNPVTEAWTTIFRGFVADWVYTVHPTEDLIELELELVDGFDLLAAAQLVPGEAGDTPPAGSEGNVFYENTADHVDTRINAILGDIGWPGALAEVFSGNVNVQDTVYAPNTSALTALRDAADAEFPTVSTIYMSKDGIFTFHGRQPRFRPEVAEYGIAEWAAGDLAAFAGDATTAVISELSFNRGKEAIINSALATPNGVDDTDIDAQLVQDATSILAYGIRGWSAENLITLEGIESGNDPLEETLAFGTYMVANYKDPQTRVSKVVFVSRLEDDPYADRIWRVLVGVELSDLISLTTTHPGGGGFDADEFYVEGIHYQVEPMNGETLFVRLELDVSPRANYTTNPFDTDVDPGP